MIQYLSLGFEDGKPDFRFYEKNGNEMEEVRCYEPDEELMSAVNNLFAVFESKSVSIKEKIKSEKLQSEIERRKKELAELEKQALENI